MLASRMSATLAKRRSRNAIVESTRAAVHPRQQAEREHVLGAGGVLAGQPELLDRGHGQAGEVDRVQGVLGERVVLQRVGGVAGLGEVPGGEVVGVDDDRGALGQVAQVRAQRGRVHRHQDVGGVAGGQDVVVREVDLERRDTRQRALGGADLGGEVGQRREVVAERGRLLGEPVAGELHAVAGVAGEPDDHPIQLLDLLGHHAPLPSMFWRPPPERSATRLPTIVGPLARPNSSPVLDP